MDRNEALDRILRERRSVRRFTDETPPRAAVEAVVEAGRLAPYAGLAHRGTTDFRRFFAIARGTAEHALLRDRIQWTVGTLAARMEAEGDARKADLLAVLRRIAEQGPPPWEAPWLLVVAERRGFPPREGQALAHVLENMWLKATALGLGIQIVSAVEDLSGDEAACGALGIAAGEFLLDACQLGVPADPPRVVARSEPEANLVWFAGPSERRIR